MSTIWTEEDHARHAQQSIVLWAKTPGEFRDKVACAIDTVWQLATGTTAPFPDRLPNLQVEQYRLPGQTCERIVQHIDAIKAIMEASSVQHLPEVQARLTWAAASAQSAKVVPTVEKKRADKARVPTLRLV